MVAQVYLVEGRTHAVEVQRRQGNALKFNEVCDVVVSYCMVMQGRHG